MSNYWVFKVKDDSIDGERMKGIDIYTQRMKDYFWGLNPEAKNLSNLEANDKVVFYLAGPGGQKFLGTARLASSHYTISEAEKRRLWHNKFFQPTHGVKLKDVNVWATPKSILPLITKQALTFIKDTSNWGCLPSRQRSVNTARRL